VSELLGALPAEGLAADGAALRVRPAWRATLADYVTLTKPRIMSLLVLTAVCSMVAAAGGSPATLPLAALVVGGALACGGASALNHVLDRDIDRLMGPRTASRPVAAGRISPGRAVAFGLVLSALAFAVLTVFANVLAAVLSLSGGAYYVVVYTLWLKRSTTQNIVIGGAAGAFPPMIGWAVVTGDVSLMPLILFAIIFMWTPPHFWALALYRAGDYAKAGIPMLPVVAGKPATRRQIVLYSVLLVPLTLAPWGLELAGSVYGIGAAVLGAVFLALAGLVWMERGSERQARRLFAFSILYLFLLFALLVVDRLVLGLPAGLATP
jgi:heme o synthase